MTENILACLHRPVTTTRTIPVQVCYGLQESYQENLLIRTKILNFIRVTSISHTYSRSQTQNSFNTTDGLHISFKTLDKVHFTDKAWFHLHWHINDHDSKTWSAENSHTFHKTVTLLKNQSVDRCLSTVNNRPYFFSQKQYQQNFTTN
jgi:hypothetical protein